MEWYAEIVLDNFGSTIISGGRYDGLIENTSMVGISFGLSRMMGIDGLLNMPNNNNNNNWKELYMCTHISNSIDLETKLSIVAKLELRYKTNIMISSDEKEKKLVKTISYCVQNYIKYLFVIAPDG